MRDSTSRVESIARSVERRGDNRYDVFLSHNSRDRSIVERIAEKLARAGLQPWFDKWCLTPGGRWQEEVAEGLAMSSACAVFIGPADVGAWEREELAVALDRAAKDRSFRLFLVLLPRVAEPFEASQLSPFLSTRTWVDFRRGVDDTRALQATINAIKGIPLGPEVAIEPRADISPYRGLRPFDEDHADYFFGRDADVQRLVEKLKATSFLAVLGPSGSGKSSLARAGLIPAMRRGALSESETWPILTLRPGARPLDTLASHVISLHPDLRAGVVRDQLATDVRSLRLLLFLPRGGEHTHVFLLVDQCEEVFTLCQNPQERQIFLLNLLHAAVTEGPCTVVTTLRADFYPRCAAHAEFAQQIATHQFLVGAMARENLQQAIEEPARLGGVEFEAGLVETMLDDVEDQPGALPLLEHALLELWERRRGGMLTLEAYRESGGVEGALAKRADAIFNSFSVEQQEIARRVLLRLTQPGEGAEDTRRRASMDELATLPGVGEAVESVIGALADARLLTTGGDEAGGAQVIEVSHEALIRGWPQLRQWVDDDRQGLRVHRRLTEATQEWLALDRDPDALYRGSRLLAASEWAKEHELDVNRVEREFLEHSHKAHKSELEAARRRTRRLRALAAGLALLGAVAAALALLAVNSADNAKRQRARAEKQERVATSRRLAAEAAGVLPARPETALLLSLEAYGRARTFEARNSLVMALQQDARTSMVLHTEPSDGTSIAFSPDGAGLLFADRNGKIWRWVDKGRPVGKPLHAFKGAVNQVAVSRNGEAIAFALQTRLGVWTTSDHRRTTTPLRHQGWFITDLSFSADGTTLAVADSDRAVDVWDVARHRLRVQRRHLLGEFDQSIALSPDGKNVAFGNPIRLWDIVRGTLREKLPRRWNINGDVAFSANGNALAVFPRGAVGSLWITLWDIRRGRIYGPRRSDMSTMRDLEFAPDGRTFAVSSDDGAIQLWDATRLRPLGAPLKGHRGIVDSLAFSPDGKILASSSWDGTVRVWNLARREPLATPLEEGGHSIASVAFTGAGNLVSADVTGRVRSWDAERRSLLAETDAASGGRAFVSTLSSGGRVLAAARPNNVLAAARSKNRVVVLDVRRRHLLGDLRPGNTFLDSVALSPDGKTLATLDENGNLQLWNTTSARRLGAPIQRRIPGEAIAFSPDGKYLAFMQDGVVYLWSGARHRWSRRPFRIRADEGILAPVSHAAIAFSPDEKTLASSGPDGTIRLWDVSSRRLLADPLPGHADGATSLTFSPTGKILASAGTDGMIRLFDVMNRRGLGRPLDAHAPVNSVAFDRTGRVLASGGDDGRILLWDPILWGSQLQAWKDRVCSIVRRDLELSEWNEFLSGEPYRKTCS